MIDTVVETRQAPVAPSAPARRMAHATGRAGRYLTFTLGGEVYALDILEVTEIIEFRDLTVVPMMPSFIRGVINLRGRVLPVVDMAARFGQQRRLGRPPHEHHRRRNRQVGPKIR